MQAWDGEPVKMMKLDLFRQSIDDAEPDAKWTKSYHDTVHEINSSVGVEPDVKKMRFTFLHPRSL